MNKSGRVLISASILLGIRGVLLLRETITEVFRKAIIKRTEEEISSCVKNRSEHSHWLEQVLPGRIATTLEHPHHDRLLNSGNAPELKNRLLATLFTGDKDYSSDTFYFEIVERHLFLKTIKGYEGEDLVELIFYENSAENPDENLQEILLKVLGEKVNIITIE